jgi:methyl-accepting chemotaxis protein
VQERDEDLRTKMVENTEITRAAASAAKDAFHEANSVNQKIARTNEHIERMTHGPSASVAAVAEHLEHIDQNTATIAENTKKKTDAGEC